METHKKIDLTLDEARELYKGGNKTLKEIALRAFSEDELNENYFSEITTFEDAVGTIGMNLNWALRMVEELETASKASAAMFKLNIIRKALNSGQDINLTKDPKDSCIHYPCIPLITKDSTYYYDELVSGEMEIIGRFRYKNNEYYVLCGGASANIYDGLGGFNFTSGTSFADANFAFLGCANEEIAKHFGKYFGVLITEAKFGDLDGFEILDFVKTKNADEKEYSVECSMTYNGHVKVNAESQEDAIEKAERLMDSKYGDDFPNYGKFGLVTFKFSDATADSAYEV